VGEVVFEETGYVIFLNVDNRPHIVLVAIPLESDE
jgi:hypothetical protein